LRLWPAWLIVVAQTIALMVVTTPSIQNVIRFLCLMAGPLLASLLFSGWLLFASRLARREKAGIAVAGLVCPLAVAFFSVHESALWTTLWVYGVPLAIVLVTVALTVLGRHRRRAFGAVLLLGLGWSVFLLLRNEGFDGSYHPGFAWRWSPGHEATLRPLAILPDPVAPVPDGLVWPQFRGPNGNGAVADDLPRLNWPVAKPKELWRIPIGLGWSSFAYDQGRLYTQEQRGGNECITCYSAQTGAPLWSHADASRFAETVSGAGPRSTPSVAAGLVYALGGNGLLTCLEAAAGKPVWQRDLAAELQAPVPMWGFSGSPLVLGDKLIVYAGGAGDNGLLALDRQTGKTLWGFASADMNYTTPRAMVLDGQECIVFCDRRGVHALAPADGKPLWTCLPKNWQGPGMIDPQQVSPTSLIVALGDGVGLARLEVKSLNGQWRIEETWSSDQLGPSFNDFVVLDGHLYGFDQARFSCLDAGTGVRKWQGNDYGFGQAVLLKTSAQILIVAENGDVVLVPATPQRFSEIARLPVLNDKTWNHPIVVGNRLFLRNGKTAVCLQLAP
jgi:outer membrane protein assembly factor BamB